MKLTFLGGTGTVTGSKYLLETEETRVLVDCGLFQGVKTLRERNWRPPPVRMAELDAVLLTHAHIDHSGYVPVLVRDGFQGRVHCTAPTRDLCSILLPDCGHLHEEDARYANRKGFSRHHPAEPLYTQEDGERALQSFSPVEFGSEFRVGDLSVTFVPAGHILGASSILVEHRGTSVLFSGDLGRDDDLLMNPPVRPDHPDFVLIESTYGNRFHPNTDPLEVLEAAAKPCLERKGVVLLPSFAVGRAQTLLYCFHRLFAEGRLPRVPVYLDSPMAVNATGIYERNVDFHRLNAKECSEVCGAAILTNSVEDSMALNFLDGPLVIISASGMLTGGRVLHHLKSRVSSSKNTILLPGYQPPGTRGHTLLGGAQSVKIHGEYAEVRAEVKQLDVFSAHADQKGLLDWLGGCKREPRQVFVTHGDSVPSDTLRLRIQDDLGFRARVPEHGEVVNLD